ncbi:amino acid/amide ABC transporter membrane protein 1 (HAAT family) [Stella humosa]|uniref:Amino acid/amide ABC transporter membrane protein 1 (HAAT family) n=1 Tax=Stella humosa TaxID=94 RepID=A0A3N1KX62_9PROT|nr:branched-chain amino acid ABC transporter permease [Stella humosa]ROP83200.1 amino acid/amide ABC transporter membrane protein 1 (HAAT family) [Stella humosa]BBK30021.1 branched-chain amino acid ABC transporter permease [Stella humosa]
MTDLLQLLLSALSLGSTYALVALGFVLVLNATNAVNFAQGELVVAGGFLAVALSPMTQLPGVVLLPAVMLGTGLIGLALSLVAFLPLRRRPPTAVFISTIAFGIIVQNMILALSGPEPATASPLVAAGQARLGEASIGWQALAMIATAAVLIGLLHLLLERTQLGRRLRATAQDPEIARALGIPVIPLILLSFALAGALAGAAGLLVANQFFVTPADGANFMLKAYIAVVIGGWGRIWGAVLGALLIALFESFVAAATSHLAADALLYVALLAVLLLRPTGILGEATGRRA